jgi:uncharacterized protein YidB (DUF937 family)
MDQTTREQCRQAVSAYNAKLQHIRADRTLSELGRREAIRAAYDQTVQTVSKAKAEDAAKRETQRSGLQRQLFGLSPAATPDEVVAYRDAQDRVAQVKDATALGELMQRAHDAGDRQLLKAAAAHAFASSRSINGGQHFGQLVDEYAEQTATGRTLEEYRAVLSTASATASTVEALETTPPVPAELRDRHVPSDEEPRRVGVGFSTPGHVPGGEVA